MILQALLLRHELATVNKLLIAIAVLLAVAVLVAGLPLLFHLVPALVDVTVLGMPLTWVLLAFAVYPFLVLLDEPMSALDARVREHLCTELRQLQRNLGITTLMVTHNQDEAMLMADRIAVMNNGRVEQYATPQEIYNRPATPFVAEFVGQGNWLPFQRSSASHAQVGGMNLRLADGSAKTASGRLFCRPEAINVNPLVHEENLFPAKVREITFLGNRCRMSFELDQLPGHALLAELAPEAMPRLGAQQIMVALPPRSLQVFA